MKFLPPLSESESAQVQAYCLGLLDRFTLDYSSYALGRRRLWLFSEVDLRSGKISQGYSDRYLEELCQFIYPGCTQGLISYHGTIKGVKSNGSIKPHRDHSCVQRVARTLNIGECGFICGDDSAELRDGQIIEFDCKKLHSVSDCSIGRVAINLWKLKPVQESLF